MAINPLFTNVVNSWTACTCTWLYIYGQTIAGSMHPVSARARVMTHAEIEIA